MCSKSPPKPAVAPKPPPPPEPVAPLVTAAEVDDTEANRKKGINALKVETSKGSNATGLNIP